MEIDEPFMRQTDSGEEHYLRDALGSVLALTNGAGTVTERLEYEPFGKSTSLDVSENPFQYAGRENDGAGLYFYQARYYDTQKRRFLSQDLLGFPINGFDATRYAYVTNNPANFTDPLGLAKMKKGLPGSKVEVVL